MPPPFADTLVFQSLFRKSGGGYVIKWQSLSNPLQTYTSTEVLELCALEAVVNGSMVHGQLFEALLAICGARPYTCWLKRLRVVG